MKFKYISFLIICFASNSIIAQNSIQLIPHSSSIRVFGTSNIHDWEMNVKFQNEVSSYKIQNNSIKSLENIKFEIEGSRLKSEKSAMQKKAHKALKLTEHPLISFLLKKIKIKNSKTTSLHGYALGILTISGQSKNVTLPINVNFIGKKKINLRGNIDLKMSDFKIEAPTVFFGAITTADEIKVLYSLDFSSKQKLTSETISCNLTP